MRVQTVLFETPVDTCARLVAAVGACAAVAVDEGSAATVTVAVGDCTPVACLDDRQRTRVGRDSLVPVAWRVFGDNLGHGAAQNRLAADSDEDVLVMVNPDAYPAPTALHALLVALDRPGVGMVDGRQIPVEVPKAVDPATGDTPWCSGCFAALPRALFVRLGGFDEAFFLHGDDVDLSWRVRAEGLRTVYVPGAAVFHPRGVEPSGYATSNEVAAHHMHLSGLLRAWKARRPDLVDELVAGTDRAGERWERSANDEFRRRRDAGLLPVPYPFDASRYLADVSARRF
ncbi:MAG TPA: glycosyltransferase [Acidimicrobiales bacterium]|nr:glycosyltransferase [Acidimicrobiales bacterium]